MADIPNKHTGIFVFWDIRWLVGQKGLCLVNDMFYRHADGKFIFGYAINKNMP
jgi:hypothetical protein